MAQRDVQLTVSLPRNTGIVIKETVERIAASQHRSVANLLLLIITEWIDKNGYEFKRSEPNKETLENVEDDKISPTW